MSRRSSTLSNLIDDLEFWRPFTPISSAEAARLDADLREKRFTDRRPLTTLFEVGTDTTSRKHQPPSSGLNHDPTRKSLSTSSATARGTTSRYATRSSQSTSSPTTRGSTSRYATQSSSAVDNTNSNAPKELKNKSKAKRAQKPKKGEHEARVELPAMVYLPFTVNDTFKETQKPLDVLFGSIPQASDPQNPNSAAYRPTHKSSQVNEDYYSGDLHPTEIPNSFLRSSFHPQFFQALKGLKDCLVHGYRSLAFDYRCEKHEGDSGDSVLTNILLPVLELVQHVLKDSLKKHHRIIIASQHSSKVSVGEEEAKGSVDYVFFAVMKNARTARFDKVEIVDHLPRKQWEWKALVIVEAKNFGSVYPEEFVQQTWETRFKTRKTAKKLPGLKLKVMTARKGGCASNAGCFVSQIRKYGDTYECDNILLTDYINSAAFCIPHSLAKGVDDQLGRCLVPTPIETKLIGNLNRKHTFSYDSLPVDANPLDYGPRLALLYMLWQAFAVEQENKLALA